MISNIKVFIEAIKSGANKELKSHVGVREEQASIDILTEEARKNVAQIVPPYFMYPYTQMSK